VSIRRVCSSATESIKTDPLLNPLRGEPRFQALVAKVFAPKDGKPSP
jgi:hypothetical protein